MKDLKTVGQDMTVGSIPAPLSKEEKDKLEEQYNRGDISWQEYKNKVTKTIPEERNLFKKTLLYLMRNHEIELE